MSVKTLVHGSLSTYTNHRCRCAECRAANAAYFRRRQAERARELALGLYEVEHGRQSTYGNYGCRCEACTAAKVAAERAYEARKR